MPLAHSVSVVGVSLWPDQRMIKLFCDFGLDLFSCANDVLGPVEWDIWIKSILNMGALADYFYKE